MNYQEQSPEQLWKLAKKIRDTHDACEVSIVIKFPTGTVAFSVDEPQADLADIQADRAA